MGKRAEIVNSVSEFFLGFFLYHHKIRIAMSSSTSTYDVKLNSQTVAQLRQRISNADGDTVDAVLAKMLDETSTTITPEEFLNRVIEDCDPVQISVVDAATDFHIVVNSATKPDPDLFKDVDGIEINGKTHTFSIEYDAYGPKALGRTTVYAVSESENGSTGEQDQSDVSVSPVSVAEGIEKLRELAQEHREE